MKKYLVAFCLLIFTFLFGAILMSVPRIWTFEGSPDGWLGYWGGITGAFLGVVGAYFVMNEQLQQEKNKEIEKKSSFIVPGSSKKEVYILSIGREVASAPKYFHEIGHFSALSFPLINAGITPIFDIEYFYSFKNQDELAKCYKKSEDYQPQKLWIEEDISGPGQQYTILMKYNYVIEGKQYTKKIKEPILSYGASESVLMPGETMQLHIDKKTNMMLSHIFQSLFFVLEMKKYVFPIIEVTVKFKDYNLKQRSINFNLEIGDYALSDNRLEIKLKPELSSINSIV